MDDDSTTSLRSITALRRTGAEQFLDGTAPLPFKLLDFWCWSTSDLLNNTTRGVIAEFLVAQALGLGTSGVREPWAAYDLLSPEGIRIEVKSSAYVQSWAQQKLSSIIFRTPETYAWNAETSEVAKAATRQADVYVFALLAHRDKNTVNPLDVSQWEFFVLPANTLNTHLGARRSITLKSIVALAGRAVVYEQLGPAIRTTATAAPTLISSGSDLPVPQERK